MSVTTKFGVLRDRMHPHCLLCGDHNPLSLRLHFVGDQSGVHATFTSTRFLQGYNGILHGGVIAALLDSAMTHCLFHHGIQALTAELHVRYHKPVPCETKLQLKASIQKAHPPLFTVHSELILQNQLMAEGDGKFMETLGEPEKMQGDRYRQQ